MNKEKIRSYVGFAIKSGKVRLGIDNIISSKRTPYITFYDASLSDNSKNKLFNFCIKNSIIREFDMEFLIPQKGCKALGITDKNLALAIKNNLEDNK